MQFCSVGTLKLNGVRRSGAGERAYMFDSTLPKPKTKEEYLKLIPSARTIGLGQANGKIKTAPIAGIAGNKRYLLALSAPNFDMTSGNFAVATRDFDSMLNMYGILSPDNLASPGHPSNTVVPRIGKNTVAASCDSNNALTFGGCLMVFAPPTIENQNLRYDLIANTYHSYYVDKSRWNGGQTVWTSETYTQYNRAVAMRFDNYSQNNQKSAQIGGVSAGNTSVAMGTVLANAANFYQPTYDKYLYVNNSGGGSPSTSSINGTYQAASAGNFRQTSAPYIVVNAADEQVSLSFSAMMTKEMNGWRLTVSDFGTDLILDADSIPNTTPGISLSDVSFVTYPSVYKM